MRHVHQFTEAGQIACLQCGYRIDGALILIYGVFCTLQAYRILDQALVRLEFFRSQVSKRIDLHALLHCLKSFCTLSPAVVVCGVNKAVFYFAVGNNDLCILKDDRGIFVV